MNAHRLVAKAAPVPARDPFGLVAMFAVFFLGLAFYFGMALLAVILIGCGGEEADTGGPVVDDMSQDGEPLVESKKITTTTEHVANIVFRESTDVIEECSGSMSCTAELSVGSSYSITADGVEGVLYYDLDRSVQEKDATEMAFSLPWGIAPDGVYTNKNGEKINVSSYLNDLGETEVMIGAIWAKSVTTNLEEEYDTGNRLNGSVSEDRKTITWTIYSPDDEVLDSDRLTL